MQDHRKTEIVETIYGQRLLAFAGDTITRKIRKKGCYDIRTIEFMRRYLKYVNDARSDTGEVSSIYADIGANIGNHALPVAPLCRHMYLFEPISKVADVLRGNLKCNRIENFTLLRMALSDSPRRAPIYIRRGNIGASSINRDEMAKKGDDLSQNELIHIDTGDKVLGEQNLERLDLVKIDVESHEAEVVLGMSCVIERFRPVIILEWNHPLTAERFEQLGLFERIFKGYFALSISDNHRAEHWKGKWLGMLRRNACHLMTRRRLRLEKFNPSSLYKNIVLFPEDKQSLVLGCAHWPIPDRILGSL